MVIILLGKNNQLIVTGFKELLDGKERESWEEKLIIYMIKRS
jgi:hypothetical protein